MNSQKTFRVYLLLCKDGSLYCGITNDITRRLEVHNAGRASKYTRCRLPVRLHTKGPAMSKSEALKLEYRIKHVRRPDKVALLLAARSSPKKEDIRSSIRKTKSSTKGIAHA